MAGQAARALLLPVGSLTAVLLVLNWLGPPESPNPAVRAAVAIVHFDFLRGKLRGIYAITGFSSVLIEGGLLVLGLIGLGLALAWRAVRINGIGAAAVTAMIAPGWYCRTLPSAHHTSITAYRGRLRSL
jgi:hypothetical protein